MNAPTRRIVFALAALVSALLSGCYRSASSRTANTSDEAGAPLAVRVAQVQSVNLPRTQPVAGTLRPLDHAVLATKIMGTVTRADFTVGQSVAAGETLVTLSADEITARLAQAQSGLDAILREQARETTLRDQGVSPADTVLTLADRRRSAEAAVREAQSLQNYTRVTAPFAGVITRKLIQLGDLALPGTPLLEIEGTTDLRAEVDVPASLPLPPLGTELRVVFTTGETTGTLTEISPAADPLTRTRHAKITLPATAASAAAANSANASTPDAKPAARSGDFVRVLWPAGESAAALTVPAEAVSPFGQMERVFVRTEGRAQLRLIKTAGAAATGRLLVSAGLEANETVILAPPASLRDGQPVEAQP
ncbi:MAG: efflux RND transporter periplasmic adaptor subunit [Opitutus sp.]|nr:efflux RND transporter periplasmic adaptor subunit [Opitutus sp.]MCS6246161.1 efflux RND transporter periplasmic adaptor subunit [Opitutus sp.]MCS6272994.1 efflux RND transporter periplasmic adaptor subunit [Opitutus sp.]MCS6278500.1 efflux RND transporter periplasmic adaptor subunit [Opitutus sp.]MCS6300098.1 efflux RND transporter periplasmic adaptor subunit [Opitutus sp.]